MARICICIPTRNRAAYVQQALASVLAQTGQEIRLIVSDDASEREIAAAVEPDRRRQLAAVYRNYAIIRCLRRDTAGLYGYLWKCVRRSPGRWRNWVSVTFAACPFLIKPVFGSGVGSLPAG